MKNSSLAAYADIKSTGKDKSHRDIIISTLKRYKKPKSAFFLETRCKLSRLQISRRMLELVTSGIVKEHEDVFCKIAGKCVTHYTLR